MRLASAAKKKMDCSTIHIFTVPFILGSYLKVKVTVEQEQSSNEISYFTTESFRALEYICGGNSSVCDYDVIHKNPRERLSDSGNSRILPTPYPLTTGYLKTCKTTDFRKSHRKYAPSTFKCSNVALKRFLAPDSVDADRFLLEVDTYFMTKKNYQEMKRGVVTKVVIPLSEPGGKNDVYTIPVVAVAFHHAPVLGCIFKTPTETKLIEPPSTKVHDHFTKLVYALRGSLMEKSGLYTYKCSGNQSTFIGDVNQRVILSVSLYINFVIEPAIFIEGHDGYYLTFPPNKASGNFMVNIYTTSQIDFMDVISSDQKEVEVAVIFHSYPTFEVVAKFEVRIPLPDDGEERIYILHAQTEEKKIAIQEITVVKAEWLSVSTIPDKLEVMEGFVAAVDCIARGNVVGEMKWSRDYEPLDDKYAYRLENSQVSGHKSLRLVFVEVQLNYSGVYTCTVSNAHETVKATLHLVVWPDGDTFLFRVLADSMNLTRKLPPHHLTLEEVTQLRGSTFSSIPPSLGLGLVVMGLLSTVLCSTLVTAITPAIIYCFWSSDANPRLKGSHEKRGRQFHRRKGQGRPVTLLTGSQQYSDDL